MAEGSTNTSEKFRWMLQWNTNLPQPVETPVHTLIKVQVAQHPDSQAVCSSDGDLTYSELDDYSNRLASKLRGKGVGSEVVVPVAFEKSRWAVVSALAVLKAGGAFLLLDTSQPIARLKSIVDQTGAQLALSSSKFSTDCRSLIDQVFVVEDESLSGLDADQFSLIIVPSNAAYYTFTSGSTGSPKGVIIEHSQLSTTAVFCGRRMGYEAKPRVFQFASYAFDMCITDIFATLVHGGTVCIPSDWERNNDIVGTMQRMKVTSARFTPSLVSNLDLEKVSTLETLILGGESCPAVLANYWASKLRLILAYGPTEGCVVCIFSEASDHECAAGEIGRPVTCDAWIVKPEDPNVLCEIGEVGELLVQGPNVARGYLNDEVKTDRQFVHDLAWMPKHNCTNSAPRYRAYRTGDLSKFTDDGRLCWVGRVDNQVKIRGQRLELEEVEKRLHDCLNGLGVELRQVVVDAVMLPGMASKQLLAFLCLRTEDSVGYLEWDTEDPSNPALRTSSEEQTRFLSIVSKLEAAMRTVLPAYAIPSVWIPLRDVPFTLSRKRDRNRLRTTVARLSAKKFSVFLRPTMSNLSNGSGTLTANELSLQELWAAVFGIDCSSIEVTDNFFSIGGDSVLAIRLAAAARTHGLDLSLQIIFQNPLLTDMAQATERISAQDSEEVIIPPFSLLNSSWDVHDVRQQAASQCGIDYLSVQDIYPCSPMQEGLMALSSKDAGTYLLCFVFHMPENADLEKLHVAWETVSKRTPVLRTRFVDYNAELLQAVVDEEIDWKVIEQDLDNFQDDDEEEDRILGKRMSRHTILRQYGSKAPILIWTIHHALVDGWAESNITASVEDEYRGNASSLSAMPMFNRFIKHLGEQDQEPAKAFWKQNLAGAPIATFPPLPYPTYVPKIKRSNRIAELTAEQGAQLDHKIIFVKGGSSTVATMIQAAWFILVGIYSNSSDVITGVTLNGRTAKLPGIDQIAGPTISTVPFRAKINRYQSVEEYLKSIQDQVLNILPFAQFGLQNIRRLSEDAVSACKFRSLLLVQATNRPAASSKLILERSFAFPVMDFAIVMECEVSKEGIDMRATFDHNVLSQLQVNRMFLQMEDILRRIMSRTPSMRVLDLQRISEADMSQTSHWNSNQSSVRDPSFSVHGLIQQNAKDRGSEIAIHAWNGDLTYEALNNYADRLAAHLQIRHGVTSDSFVAVAFEKSKWAVVSLLAVLKAGAVGVPLDPTASDNNTDAIFEALDDTPQIILTSRSCLKKYTYPTAVLEIDEQIIERLDDATSPSLQSKSSAAAFILFKISKSDTPQPLVLDHDNFCSNILSWGKFIQRGAQSRVLLNAGYTFYSGLAEMFSTLILGGCLCIPEGGAKSLAEDIISLNANELSLTPSLARWLRPMNTPSLKTLITTGEPLTKELINTWTDHVKLVNLYRCAEMTGYCFGASDIRRGDPPGNIRQWSDTSAWTIHPDDTNTLIPPGGIGELVVNIKNPWREDLRTRDTFFENPTWATSLEQDTNRGFIRTGDLASYDTHGSLNLVGRKRTHIQIDGHRVDISEVEIRLQEVVPSSVAVTVVSMHSKDNRKSQLVAFLGFECDMGEDASNNFLADTGRDFKELLKMVDAAETKLKSFLPSHWRPSEYFPVRSISLTASGKVDRQRLEILGSSLTPIRPLSLDRHTTDLDTRSPLTKMERRISELWKTLLEVEDVGGEDNFFQLGGGSVLAMRLVSMARSNGLTLTVSGIFNKPTLREIASTVQQKTDTADIAPFALLPDLDITNLRRQAASQCNVEPHMIEDIYPCSFFQLHYVTGYPEACSDPKVDPWHWQSQGAYSLPPHLDLNRFQDVWNLAVQRHPVLRTRLIHTPLGILQVVLKSCKPMKWSSGTDLTEYLLRDQVDYMTFGQELLRLGIVQSEESNEGYFIFTVQHVIYDAFMRSMLFKEVEAAYFKGHFPDTHLPRMNKFINYITQTDKQAARKFWTSYLEDAETKLLLNTVDTSGSMLNVSEKRMTTASVKSAQQSLAEVTLPTIIEVASALAIAHMVECRDVVFYSDRSGRNLPVEGIQDLIGPTTLFLPVRVHIEPKQKIHELLRQCQSIKSAMIPHEHLGFLELREMDHLKAMLRSSLNINITPKGIASSNKGWGLELRSSHLTLCDDPFGINVNLHDDRIDWLIYFDERYISVEKVERLLDDIRLVFFELVNAEDGAAVAGIFGTLTSGLAL